MRLVFRFGLIATMVAVAPALLVPLPAAAHADYEVVEVAGGPLPSNATSAFPVTFLTSVVDTDPPTTTAPPSTSTTSAGKTTSTVAPAAEAVPEGETVGDVTSSGSSRVVASILVGGVAVVLLAGGLYLWRNEK